MISTAVHQFAFPTNTGRSRCHVYKLSAPIRFGEYEDVAGTTRNVVTSTVLVPARLGVGEYWETAVFAANAAGDIIGAPLGTTATTVPGEALWELGYTLVDPVPEQYDSHTYLTEQIARGLSAFLEEGTFTAAGSEWNPINKPLDNEDAPTDEITLTFTDDQGLEVSLSLTVAITKVEGQ